MMGKFGASRFVEILIITASNLDDKTLLMFIVYYGKSR